jgi:nicotinamide riboside transporter PnuC
MPSIETIQWISVCLSLTGMLLVTHKIRAGWIFWVIASCSWLYIFWVKEVEARMVVEAVYGASAVYGFWRWGRDRKKGVTDEYE